MYEKEMLVLYFIIIIIFKAIFPLLSNKLVNLFQIHLVYKNFSTVKYLLYILNIIKKSNMITKQYILEDNKNYKCFIRPTCYVNICV